MNIFFVLALTLIAIYFCIKMPENRIWRWVIPTLFLILFVSLGIYFVANSFTGFGVDESVIYHLRVGLAGADFSSFLPLILKTISYIILVLMFAAIIFDLLGKRRLRVSRALSKHVKQPYQRAPYLASAALLLAIVASPLSYNLWNLLRPNPVLSMTDLKPFEFIVPESFQIKNKKNIIFIYMEGLERTYLDPTLYDDLAPNLVDIENRYDSFENIQQVYSTNYTIAGLVASQCGVPLYAANNVNSMDRMDKFLPNITCLGDILKTNGYNVEFTGGAKKAFSGKAKFLLSHGFGKVLGRQDHLKEEFGFS